MSTSYLECCSKPDSSKPRVDRRGYDHAAARTIQAHHGPEMRVGDVGHSSPLPKPSCTQARGIFVQWTIHGTKFDTSFYLVQLAWWLGTPRPPLSTTVIGRSVHRTFETRGLKRPSVCHLAHLGPDIHYLSRTAASIWQAIIT